MTTHLLDMMHVFQPKKTIPAPSLNEMNIILPVADWSKTHRPQPMANGIEAVSDQQYGLDKIMTLY